MKEKVIKVLKVAPGEEPVVCELDNNLSSLQEDVSIGADYVGLIEIIPLTSKVCIVCNEEAKLIGLSPNRYLDGDILCGVFYVTGQNRNGELTSLSEKQIKEYMDMFREIEFIPPEEVENTILFSFVPFTEE